MHILIITLSIVLFIYLVVLLALGRFLGYNDIFRRKKPDKSKIEGYSYEDIEFFTTEGLKLKGWLVLSNNNPSNRTLILLHGWHRNRDKVINHAKYFVDNGFHVVIYDQRSHGESDTGLITFGKGESLDLLSCVEYLKSKESINIEKLGALGFSLGSGGLIYAASTPEGSIFKAIVLEGAYANSYDTGLFMLQNRFGKMVGYIIGVMFFTIGTKIMSFGKFHHSQPYKYIGKIKNTPIMIIRGDNDYMVPKFSSERLINSIESTKYIWITKKGNHTDSFYIYPEEYKFRVLGFLNTYL